MEVLSARSLERITAALVALELFLIVAATSANLTILLDARRLRWAVLAALVVAVAGLLVQRRERPRRLVLPALLGLAFVGLALLSTAWSAAGRLSAPHAVSLAVLLFVVGGIAFAVRGRPEALALQLEAFVGGAALVALAGLAMLVADRGTALQPAETAYPTRYRGLGGNPDTASLLFALAVPVALSFALRPHPRRRLHAAACVLFVGSIAPSASRGALLAALVGSAVVVLLLRWTWRRRALAAALLLVVALASVGVSKIPKPLHQAEQTNQAPHKFQPNAELALPLDSEPGYRHGAQQTRSLTSSSGRLTAWGGALHQASDRIFLGYGFATEDKVFVDRYPVFFARRVENAYLGTLLELGLAGLGLLLALVVAILVTLRRAPDRLLVAGPAGAFAAGLALATVQSYLFSVGGTGSLAFWLVAALLVAASLRTPNSA